MSAGDWEPPSNLVAFPGGSDDDAERRVPPDGSRAWMRWQVMLLRTHRRLAPDDKYRAIFNFIWGEQLRRGGNFFRTKDNKAYMFDGGSKRLYEVNARDARFRAFLGMTYGLLQSEQITRHVVALLEAGTLTNGLLREFRRFCSYDTATKTLYISRYNGTCWKLDGSSVEICPNGQSVIFADDDGGVPCAEPEIGPNGILFPSLIDDVQYIPTTEGGLTPEAQRTCLGIWIFALAFPDLMPSRPILLVEGEKGSGKSTFIQRVQLAVHGVQKTLSLGQNDENDFGVMILRCPVALIDNVDTQVDWMRDALCTYATGGSWVRRRKYSDTDEVLVAPRAFIAIATKNPATFRRDDLADRLLITRLESREGRGEYVPAQELFEGIEFSRGLIFGEWLYWLNKIVAELRKGRDGSRTQHRMADWAGFGDVVGRVFAQDANAPTGNWTREGVAALLEDMQAERDELVIEGDSLVDLLDRWLDTEANQGRELRCADLFSELKDLSVTLKVSFFRNPRSLGHRLRDVGGSLARHFLITKRILDGAIRYAFRRAT